MSAYNPPLFNNSTIQFNPTIYETETTSTASQTLTLLKTDNIQCKTTGDTVSLYTVASGLVTIGTGGQGLTVVGLLSATGAEINGINTTALDTQTGQNFITIGTSATNVIIRPTNTQITGNLQANTLDKYTTGSISLYATATGNITLGNSTAGTTTSLNSPITNITSLKTNTIAQQSGSSVDIQDLRFVGAQLYPKTSQTLYLGNANCPTIEIGTGSTTTTINGAANTFIKNTISTVVGTNPTSYINSAGTISGVAMNLYNMGTQSALDMYSSGLTNALPSSRFISTGGSALINTAALQIQAGTIAVEPVGNLTLGSGTTVNTYVKSSTSFVTGTNPTSYSNSGATTIGKNIGLIISASTQTDIKFWSADVGTNAQPSASISVNGGTASANSGSLTLNAKNITLHAVDAASILSCDATTVNVGTSNTTNINIGTNTATTNLNIGNGSINPIKIQTSDRVVMGNNPSSYNTTTGVLTGAGCVVGTNGTGPYNAFIDLYSYAGTLQSNSARIMSNSAGLTISNNIASTPLTLATTGKIVSSQEHNFNGGISYGRGNLTSPSFTQTGFFGNGATTVAANGVVNYSATWAAMGLANFGTNPTVICCNGTSSGLGQKLIISCYGATTTQVSFSLYNPSSSTTGSVSITINFIATGGY